MLSKGDNEGYTPLITTGLLGKLLIGCLLLAALAIVVFYTVFPKAEDDKQRTTPRSIPTYSATILNTYTHDKDAFTQGLAFNNGALYEGTGLYGKSSLRKVDLETGKVLQVYRLPSAYFGEGITIWGDTILQLTWQSNIGFVYDRNSLEVLRDFTFETEGWGITHDEKRLIVSDGTSTLHFLDADTFRTTGHIQVHDNDTLVENLNELEYVNGQIYANIWPTDSIAMIDPHSGRVAGWIDLSGILLPQVDNAPVDVLNGIAYDVTNGRLFVTGKLWPRLFEIELVTK
jgi:glutamine cyclotransferase